MAYRIAVIQVTLSDFQGHSPTASLFKCDFFRAAVTASRGPSAIAEIRIV